MRLYYYAFVRTRGLISPVPTNKSEQMNKTLITLFVLVMAAPFEGFADSGSVSATDLKNYRWALEECSNEYRPGPGGGVGWVEPMRRCKTEAQAHYNISDEIAEAIETENTSKPVWMREEEWLEHKKEQAEKLRKATRA